MTLRGDITLRDLLSFWPSTENKFQFGPPALGPYLLWDSTSLASSPHSCDLLLCFCYDHGHGMVATACLESDLSHQTGRFSGMKFIYLCVLKNQHRACIRKELSMELFTGSMKWLRTWLNDSPFRQADLQKSTGVETSSLSVLQHSEVFRLLLLCSKQFQSGVVFPHFQILKSCK